MSDDKHLNDLFLNLKGVFEQTKIQTPSKPHKPVRKKQQPTIPSPDPLQVFIEKTAQLISNNLSKSNTPISQTQINNTVSSYLDSLQQLDKNNPRASVPSVPLLPENINLEQLTNTITQKVRSDVAIMADRMSSGGGSVAKQFANGGTMKGSLEIQGNLTTSGTINGATINNAGLNTVYTTITTSYTATSANSIILCDCTTTPITVLLPPVSSINTILHIKRIDGSVNSLTVSGYNDELIDGTSTIGIVNQYSSFTLFNNNTQWWVI